MRKILTYIVLLGVTLPCFNLASQTVTYEEALSVATNLMSRSGIRNVTAGDVEAWYSEGKKVLYCVSFDDGWVLVSADHRATPVAAFSPVGYLDTSDAPPALMELIKSYMSQVATIPSGTLQDSATQAQWESLHDEPSVESTTSMPRQYYHYSAGRNLLDNTPRGIIRWNQEGANDTMLSCEYAYNKYAGYIPFCGSCYKAPTGCGPVAMGQVMWYWQWPKKSPYIDRDHYNWNIMPGRIVNGTPMESVDAIAYLLKDCGTAVNICYTCQGSFNLGEDLLNGMQLFGYQSITARSYQSWSYGNAWTDLIRSEIDNGRPVILFGMKTLTSSWHFFITDGYRRDDTGFFHINWGWGNGHDSVYVRLPNIFASDTSYYYNYGKAAYVGISPTYSDTMINKVFYDRLETSDYEVSLGDITLPESRHSLRIESGASLTLAAGHEIVLQDEFEAVAGSEVSAWVDTSLVNRLPIIVPSWPSTIQPGSDGLYIQVRNANSYELTVKDARNRICYQSAGLVRDDSVRVWRATEGYNPNQTYECTIKFKNNFGRALGNTFLINDNRDGQRSAHPTTEFDIPASSDSLQAYPNPVTNWLTIDLNGNTGCDIELYNETGQICLHDSSIDNPRYYIDASLFPAGVYLLKVRSRNHLLVKKIIIQ